MQKSEQKIVFTFGPVNSRRFGISLGIDLSPKEKCCNFDCLYCELKAKKPIDFIKDPPLVKEVVKEVEKKLSLHKNIDVITITSNGEPTLYENLEELVDELNKIKQNKKLLILSNSSKICEENIKKTLQKIDLVKLSLDCATNRCFKRLDRPLKEIKLENIINCMQNLDLKTLIIEILVVEGINDNEKEFEKLNEILQIIKPNRVDIGTIDRPPAYKVKKVDEEKLEFLAKKIKNLPVCLIKNNIPKEKENFSKDEILNLLNHRPQSQFDIENFFSQESKLQLQQLLNEKKVIKENIGGVEFYKAI